MTIFVSIWPDRAVCLLSVCVIISFDLDTWHTSSLWQYLGYVWRSGSLVQICGQRRNIAKVVDVTLSEGFCSCHIRWLVCWFMLAINLTTLFKKFVCFISHRALCWTMILTWRLSRLLRWLCLRLFKTIFFTFLYKLSREKEVKRVGCFLKWYCIKRNCGCFIEAYFCSSFVPQGFNPVLKFKMGCICSTGCKRIIASQKRWQTFILDLSVKRHGTVCMLYLLMSKQTV